MREPSSADRQANEDPAGYVPVALQVGSPTGEQGASGVGWTLPSMSKARERIVSSPVGGVSRSSVQNLQV
jgi:hypothetical protein